METINERLRTAGQRVNETFFGATLKLDKYSFIPCTHSKILGDFDFGNGLSSKLTIESIQFRAALVPPGLVPAKFMFCQLKINPAAAPLKLQLWSGGLLPGGELYQFMAVDENFKA